MYELISFCYVEASHQYGAGDMENGGGIDTDGKPSLKKHHQDIWISKVGFDQENVTEMHWFVSESTKYLNNKCTSLTTIYGYMLFCNFMDCLFRGVDDMHIC